MKRILELVLIISIIATLMIIISVPVVATISGSCGADLTWILDDEGTLAISGAGDMGSYTCWNDYKSSIKNVMIEEGVTSIGDFAFSSCKSLRSITIPDGVTSIGDSAFSGCENLASLTIPDGVTSIGNSAFYNCESLTSITIPDGVTSIGNSAFYNCERLTSITIPDSVTIIGNSAFSDCTRLTSITIPDGVTIIDNYLFSDCERLASITIPDGVTIIGDEAFYHCSSLRSITIPDSVTSIGYYAFYNCTSLASITIPDSVTSIGGDIFYGCSNLESITLPFIGKEKAETSGTAESVFGSIFGSSGDNSGTEQKYKENETVNYDIPSSLKTVTITDESEIPYGAFSNCIHLTDIIIEGNPKVIYPEAFYGCTGLLNVTVKSKDVKYPTSNIFDKAELVTLRGYKNSSTETYANRFSDRFYFEALDADNMDQILSGTAERINNKIVVSVEIDKAVSTKCLHIALYNSTNILLDYIIVPNNKPFDHMNVVFKDNKDASYAKVFLWSGIASLEPIAEAVKVEIK